MFSHMVQMQACFFDDSELARIRVALAHEDDTVGRPGDILNNADLIAFIDDCLGSRGAK